MNPGECSLHKAVEQVLPQAAFPPQAVLPQEIVHRQPHFPVRVPILYRIQLPAVNLSKISHVMIRDMFKLLHGPFRQAQMGRMLQSALKDHPWIQC